MKTIDWLQPLPIPDEYKLRAFSLSTRRQLVVAFMLNILSLSIPVMMLQVYDRIIPHQSYGTLSILTLGVLIALGLDGMLRIMRSWLVGWTAASNEHAASCAALDHLNRTNLPDFETCSEGEHLQNLSALARLREFYSGQALTALIDVPFAIIFLLLVAYLGGILVVVPITLLIGFFFFARTVSLRLRNSLERRHISDDKKSSIMVSILSGIHSVKALGLEASLLRQYEHAQSSVTKNSYLVSLASGRAATLGAAFGQLSLIVTAAAGCLLVVDNHLSVGGLSACTLLAGRAIQPIQRVLGTWLRLQDLSLAKEQASKIFALPARSKLNQRVYMKFLGNINVDQVSFGYDDEAPKIFKNISLDVPAGRVVAITGGKSSGKSTLLQIIAGVLQPSSGSVSIDGFSPADYTLSQLAGQIGYLPQQGAIFRGTILENITGFRDDETSIRAAKEAAADLGLDSVVDFLPFGYQTLLTDTAADSIPPGVKQRISLARVLMHKPSILLFDDADRALDKEGYNKLFRIIGRLKGQCTILMVSHDQNLLSFSDETYDLDNGKLSQLSSEGSQNVSHMTFGKGDF